MYMTTGNLPTMVARRRETACDEKTKEIVTSPSKRLLHRRCTRLRLVRQPFASTIGSEIRRIISLPKPTRSRSIQRPILRHPDVSHSPNRYNPHIVQNLHLLTICWTVTTGFPFLFDLYKKRI